MQKLIGAIFILICGIYYSVSEYIKIKNQEKIMRCALQDLDKIISLIQVKKLGVSEIFSHLSKTETPLKYIYEKCVRWDYETAFKEGIGKIIESQKFKERAQQLTEILGKTTANEQVRLLENLRFELNSEYEVQSEVAKKTQKLKVSLGIIFTLIIIIILI